MPVSMIASPRVEAPAEVPFTYTAVRATCQYPACVTGTWVKLPVYRDGSRQPRQREPRFEVPEAARPR